MRRLGLVVAVLAAVVGSLLPVGVAHADPAGPTDYRSEVTAIDPPTPVIDVAILGGDSFIQLSVQRGSTAEVVGYRGEPYLWFRADGRVFENRLSPTTYLNEERFGTEFPDFADPDAEPEWKQVAADGRWSWHDHRAHLMQRVPPFGTSPGDRILESVVPLRVDGDEVTITVISVWEPEPSALPLWIGGAIGFLVVGLGGVLVWQGRTAALALLAPALCAVVAGVWQYRSLPAETGPLLTWWALPVAATAALGSSLLPFVRRDVIITAAFSGLSAVLLVVWAWLRRDGLTAAIVPSNAPNGFDRGVTVLALVAGLGGVLLAVVALTNSQRSGTQVAQGATSSP